MSMIYFNEQLRKYYKICPSCQKDIPYSTRKAARRFDNGISLCRSCSQRKAKPKQNKIYKRNCPKCNRELVYKSYRGMWRANKFHVLCKSCIHKGVNNYLYGKHLSDTHKENISKSNIGKKHTEEIKEKLRIFALQRIKKQGTIISFNPKACQFMDNFGRENGYNFRHALNGGEVDIIGYYLDGYDKERNVIFEYDECEHEKTRQKMKDLKRSERLINKLGCKIIRYSEKFNKLYQSFSTKSEIYCA